VTTVGSIYADVASSALGRNDQSNSDGASGADRAQLTSQAALPSTRIVTARKWSTQAAGHALPGDRKPFGDHASKAANVADAQPRVLAVSPSGHTGGMLGGDDFDGGGSSGTVLADTSVRRSSKQSLFGRLLGRSEMQDGDDEDTDDETKLDDVAPRFVEEADLFDGF